MKMLDLGRGILSCSVLFGHQMSPCIMSRWRKVQSLVSKQENQRQNSKSERAYLVQCPAAVYFSLNQWFLLEISFREPYAQQCSSILPTL